MRATPLERPLAPTPRKPAAKPAPDAEKAAPKTTTYADLLKQKRKVTRRPLSTGNDRI